MASCPVCSWEQGPWTKCSVSCGEGWQDRSVLCVEEDTHGQFSQVEEWRCTHSPRPITRQICNTFACPQWVAMEWSQVSKCLFTPHIHIAMEHVSVGGCCGEDTKCCEFHPRSAYVISCILCTACFLAGLWPFDISWIL